MKKLLIFSAIAGCLAFSDAKAQVVNGVRLSELKSTYIEIDEFRPPNRGKVFVRLEYGQEVRNERDNTLIKDENGKNLEFNSLVDCLNKMRSYGYELFQAYNRSKDKGTGEKVYVLKKQ